MSAPSSFHREKRRKIALSTLEEITYGTYFASDGTEMTDFGKSLEKSKEKSTMLTVGDINDQKLKFDLNPQEIQNIQIEFPLMTTVKAIKYFSTNNRILIQALDFASARCPGGGWLNGAHAQEESLMRCSGLYDCISQFDDTFYCLPKRKGIYANALISSPLVPFHKSEKGKPFDSLIECDIVTCAAVNCTEFNPRTKASKRMIKEISRLRIEMILDAFDLMLMQHMNLNTYSQRVVILGAWGCGVFRNPVKQIANLFKQIIHKRHSITTMPTTFVFAIPDQETMESFSSVFNSLENDAISSSNHKHVVKE